MVGNFSEKSIPKKTEINISGFLYKYSSFFRAYKYSGVFRAYKYAGVFFKIFYFAWPLE